MSAVRDSGDVLDRFALFPMKEAHLDQVEAIERMSYTNPWTRENFLHEVEENLLSRPVVALTRDQAEEVAGYCVYWIVFDQVQIQNVAVHPRHRRTGLGRHLLRYALQDGRAANASHVQLEVRPSNVVARKLYESMGFSEAGVRKDYYSSPSEDALLYRKEIH